MEKIKTKTLASIEEKLSLLDKDSLRYQILEIAKGFKTSWVELGRALYTVYKDNFYKEWGFSAFEVYTAKELGIRKQTALKLLRSYYFLEKEEPEYLAPHYQKEAQPLNLASFEAVDLLRKAKKKISEEEYQKIKERIFKEGKEAVEVRRELTSLIKEREELLPEEAYRKKRLALLKRFLGTLKGIREEAELLKILPNPLLKQIQEVIKKVEEQIS